MISSLSSWLLIILSALFDSYAAFIVKLKFNALGPLPYHSLPAFTAYLMKFFKDPLLVTALFTFVTAPGLWFLALNRVNLSVGYPTLVAFHLIFILFFGLGFLGETLTVHRAIGIALIALSLYFLNT